MCMLVDQEMGNGIRFVHAETRAHLSYETRAVAHLPAPTVRQVIGLIFDRCHRKKCF